MILVNWDGPKGILQIYLHEKISLLDEGLSVLQAFHLEMVIRKELVEMAKIYNRPARSVLFRPGEEGADELPFFVIHFLDHVKVQHFLDLHLERILF